MESQVNSAVAKQWAKVCELKDQARASWKKVERETAKLARLGGLGRKKQIDIPISETKAVRIKNQFRGQQEVFAPAFAKKITAEEVKLS